MLRFGPPCASAELREVSPFGPSRKPPLSHISLRYANDFTRIALKARRSVTRPWWIVVAPLREDPDARGFDRGRSLSDPGRPLSSGRSSRLARAGMSAFSVRLRTFNARRQSTWAAAIPERAAICADGTVCTRRHPVRSSRKRRQRASFMVTDGRPRRAKARARGSARSRAFEPTYTWETFPLPRPPLSGASTSSSRGAGPGAARLLAATQSCVGLGCTTWLGVVMRPSKERGDHDSVQSHPDPSR